MKRGWTERDERFKSGQRKEKGIQWCTKGHSLLESWVRPVAASRRHTLGAWPDTATPSWENHCLPWIYRWIHLTALFTFVSVHVFFLLSLPSSIPPQLCLLYHLLLVLLPPSWLCRLGAQPSVSPWSPFSSKLSVSLDSFCFTQIATLQDKCEDKLNVIGHQN